MATMNINNSITFIGSDATASRIEALKKFCVSYRDIKAMSCKARKELSDEAEYYLNNPTDDRDIDDAAYDCYMLIREVEDDEHRDENAVKVAKFYNEHIAGHTEQEYRLGEEICDIGYCMWRNLPEEVKGSYVYNDKACEYYIESYLEDHPNRSSEGCMAALDLVLACQTYSDWYKDCYGHRPHFYLD